MTMQEEQKVPVRIHQTDDHITLAAPMPGLQATDISITVIGDRVIIHGELRGPGQERREMIMEEWTVGPYRREITLPQQVNASLANATYGNGVLVLSLPKDASQSGGYNQIQLKVVESARGQHVGHTGSDAHPMSTDEHRQKMNASTDK